MTLVFFLLIKLVAKLLPSFQNKKNTANSRGQRHRDKQNMTTCRTMIATFFLQRTCNRLSFAAIAKLLFGKDEPNFN